MDTRLPGIQSLLPDHVFQQVNHASPNARSSSTSLELSPRGGQPPFNLPSPGTYTKSTPLEGDELFLDEFESPSARGPGSDERAHVCIYCQRRCNRPSLLRVHMRIHTGATPFQCPKPGCGRVFNVKSNMKRHFARHLPKLNAASDSMGVTQVNEDETPRDYLH